MGEYRLDIDAGAAAVVVGAEQQRTTVTVSSFYSLAILGQWISGIRHNHYAWGRGTRESMTLQMYLGNDSLTSSRQFKYPVDGYD